MVVIDSTSPEHRQFSIRLPRPLWAGLAIVGLVAFGSVSQWVFRTPGREFDQQLWHDCADYQAAQFPRLGMADRLIAQGTLRGKSRLEVVDVLGEPPESGFFRDWDLVYWLGPERAFFSVDSEWLVFRLNKQLHVVDYRIVRD
jgi:hypothetical protein